MNNNIGRRRGRARRLALQALYQWQLTDDPPRDILVQFQDDARSADHVYFEELVVETSARWSELDALIAPWLDRPSAQLDAVERAILFLATYELAERRDVPYRVVINEAVTLAKRFVAEDGHRYINAVLDRAAARLRADERGAGQRRE
jgi:N utilization substance protein B